MPSPVATPIAWYQEPGHGNTWQDTGGTVPAVLDGDPVARWDDQSGNGRHLLQGTPANRPVLKLATVNGRNSVHTDGTQTCLQAIFTLNQPATHFVAMLPGLVGIDRILWSGGGGGLGYNGSAYQHTSPGLGVGGWCTPRSADQVSAGLLFWDGGLIIQGFPSLPQIFSILYSGAASWVTVNDSPRFTGAVSPWTNPPGGLTIGATSDFTSDFANHDYCEMVLYDRTLSTGECKTNNDYLNGNWSTYPAGLDPTIPSILVCGDSISWGEVTSSEGPWPGTTSWPMVLNSLIGSTKVRVQNLSVPSRASDTIATYASQREARLFDTARKKNLAIFWEYVNRWDNGITDPATVYADPTSWNATMQAAGFETAIMTAIPTLDALVLGHGDFNGTFLPAYNALVTANSAGFNHVIQMDDARLQDPNNTTYFFTDKLHLVTQGQIAAAQNVFAKIGFLFGSPSRGMLLGIG